MAPPAHPCRHAPAVGVLAFAFALTACGDTASASYGTPYDSGTDAPALTVPDDDAASVPVASDPDADAAPDAASEGPALHGPPYPILMHHGFAGFRQFGALDYFYQVPADLRARGETVFTSEVSPFDPPESRARQLAVQVDQILAATHSAKVVIVGHSQGGLDARYLISSLGYGDRVAMLATVATPHQGTYVADVLLGLAPGASDVLLNAVAALYGATLSDVRTNPDLRASLDGLSTHAAVDFNARNRDDPRVTYWSWAGRSNLRTGAIQCDGARVPNDVTHVDAITPLLALFGPLLEQNNPALHVNDGLVEVQSARWGTFIGCVPADHLDEIGQIAQSGRDLLSGFDHVVFYRDVVARIRAAGY